MQFWKPDSTSNPPQSVLIDRGNQNSFSSLSSSRSELPIKRHKSSILYHLEKYRLCVIVGETGSGKTTQIPQYLSSAGWCDNQKIIACTQPTALAAVSVARRVSHESGYKLGREVGYLVRFDNCFANADAKMLFLTDQMLFRETLVDPLLTKYSVVMIDEAHERTIYTELLLGLLKK